MKYRSTYLLITIILSLIGLIMIYSSSCIWAMYKTGNEFYFLIRQGIFLFIGFIVMIITGRIPYKFW